MSDSSTNSAGGGISFIGLLTILFIGLKLTGYIDWSWLWVLSPILLVIFVPVVIFLFVFLVLTVID